MTTRRLNGMAALLAAQKTPLRVMKDEAHTEFVKRVVNAYIDAVLFLEKETGASTMLKEFVEEASK